MSLKETSLTINDLNQAAIVALTVLTTVLLSASSSGAAQLSASETAQRCYSSGDMKNALAGFEADLKSNPSNATSHYMKANCLLKLQRLPDALMEYGTAERLAPGSKLAEYCRTARAGISAKMVAPQSAKLSAKNTRIENSDDSDDADDTVTTASQAEKPAEIKTIEKNSLPPGTLELIRKQAVLARQRALEIGQAEAENELAKAENAAKSMREKAERAASHGRGSNEPVALSTPDAEAVRAQAAAGGDQIREIGRRKAAVKEWESQEKADEIKLQAENLQNRLLDTRKSRYTDVKLNPVGTNLYIRNYAAPPVVPLKVEAKMVSLDAAVAAAKSGAQSKGEKVDVGGKIVSSRAGGQVAGTRSVVSVRGQVLPK